MDAFSLINYQGSKKGLLNFIHENTMSLIRPNDTILDIFSGTSSVGYSFKRDYRVFANDSEKYAYVMAKAILGKSPTVSFDEVKKDVLFLFESNFNKQSPVYKSLLLKEDVFLANNDELGITHLYGDVPTIWNTPEFLESREKEHPCFELFTKYYSASYFGVRQAMEIDSLRYALEKHAGSELYFILLACLFHAMKQSVFSKDGHMAQPLNIAKNSHRLFIFRGKSIKEIFFEKLAQFYVPTFFSGFDNKIYNLDFEELIKLQEIRDEVDFIYADPPYTDMQYSRYYHLLNILVKYEYSEPTLINGAFTKGLYINGRFQSSISTKNNCLTHFSKLIDFAEKYGKNLAISFAYPANPNEQKTDRYVMSIDALNQACIDKFGGSRVKCISCDYTHSNNRNNKPKSVLEYLFLCRGR